MLRQVMLLVIALVSGAAYLVVSQGKRVVNLFRFWNWKRSELEQQLISAKSHDEYARLALRLDRVQGTDRWKREAYSRWYDAPGIHTRLYDLRIARLSDDWEARLLLIRENLFRNVCGLENPMLYNRCAIGTKDLIEEYIEEMALQIEHVIQVGDVGLETPTKKTSNVRLTERYISDCRQAYGRTALVFSGGVSLGMYHLGVVKCLFEQKCLPSIVCGTAIGALVAGMLGVCTDDELPSLWQNGGDGGIDFSSFESTNADGPAWSRKLRRLLKHGVLMDIGKLAPFCRKKLGDLTFQEAFWRTGRVVNITVPSNSKADGGTTLLNHITAPNVIIWSAACASCEYPGLYTAFVLLCKALDGTIQPLYSPKYTAGAQKPVRHHNDLPMQRLSELFNVNHFIVVQVQPHIIPFLRAQKSSSRFSLIHQAAMFVMRELYHRATQIAQLYYCPSLLQWVVAELESIDKGHITIVPRLSPKMCAIMLSNPSNDSLQYCVREAEKSTFSSISEIKIRCRIEFALRDATVKIRRRLEQMTDKDVDTSVTYGAL